MTVIDASSLHRFRTEVPNFIEDELDLSPYEFRLYHHLKRIAGDDGKCFKSNEKIAASCKMSVSQLRRSKKALQQPFAKLNGKPLIEIKKVPRADGGDSSDIITIVDIWEISVSHYYTKKREKETSKNVSEESHGDEGGCLAEQGGVFCENNHKKNYKEEEPIKKKRTLRVPKKDIELLKFGDFVEISEAAYSKLLTDYGEATVKEYFDRINCYLAMHDKKPYKDYAAAVRQWYATDQKKKCGRVLSEDDQAKEEIRRKNFDWAMKAHELYPDTLPGFWINSITTGRTGRPLDNISNYLPHETYKDNILSLFGVKDGR